MLLVLPIVAALGHPAWAQQQPPVLGPPVLGPPALPPPSPPASGPEILVTPLLLLAGINSAISTGLPRAPTVDSSVG
ncbi:MAG: hypothetical protein ACREET_11615, partial [Stellaceae bacterium]